MFVFDNSFVEMAMALVFILSSSIMFLAFALAALRSSREPKESKPITPHVLAVTPRKPSGSVTGEVKTSINSPVNIEERIKELTQAPRTIRLEIEFPELPEKITVPFEKLPELLKVLKDGKQGFTAESLHHNFVVQEAKQEKQEEEKSWSAFRRHDNPLLDILEKVSGLEFSEDGERVYCPRHGWVHYIVTSSGEILCGEGHENLWDPNKERFTPPSREEMEKLQKELISIRKEIEDLQRQAEMRIEPVKEEKEEYEEEEYEEYEEERED